MHVYLLVIINKYNYYHDYNHNYIRKYNNYKHNYNYNLDKTGDLLIEGNEVLPEIPRPNPMDIPFIEVL